MRHQSQNSLHPSPTFHRTSFPKCLIGSKCRSQKFGHGPDTSLACFTDKDVNPEFSDLLKVTELMPIRLEPGLPGCLVVGARVSKIF